jgi:hypothetical protein
MSCQELINSDSQIVKENLIDAGFNIEKVSDLEKYPVDDRYMSIPILLCFLDEIHYASAKQEIYTYFACTSWIKGKTLLEVIDKFFDHFENDNMPLFYCENYGELERLIEIDKAYEGVSSLYEIHLMEVRWSIGLALNVLINHRLVSHKKYKERIRKIIFDTKYRKGRSELVLIYGRFGGQDVVSDLIKLLEVWDINVLGNTIRALGRFKEKKAKPHLEKILKHEDSYFRDLARRAINKI